MFLTAVPFTVLRPVLSAAAAALALAACAGPGPDEDLPRLELHSDFPSQLKAGDTTGALEVTKRFLEANGREGENGRYPFFTFLSSDTTVIKVVAGRRLAALKAGEAAITADDDQGSARTASPATVTVVP